MSNDVQKTKKVWWENLVRRQSSIADLLPRGIDPDRFVKSAFFALTRSPRLFECDPGSVFTGILKAAEAGLDLSGTGGEAYLIPYKLKTGKLHAQFQTGYRGLIKLAFRSGKVLDIETRVVWDTDEFEIVYGLDRKLRHVPTLVEDPKAKPTVLGAYCVARFKDGGLAFEWMTRREIEAIRSRSRAANEGPWVSDWPEMARKTVARRASKYWPSMDEMDRALLLEEEDVSPGRGLPLELPPETPPPALPASPPPSPPPAPSSPAPQEEEPMVDDPPREPGDDRDEVAEEEGLFDDPVPPEVKQTRTEEVKRRLGVKGRGR